MHVDQPFLDEYQRQGFLIVRNILDAQQLSALRQLADAALAIARQDGGGQTQRICPQRFVEDMDLTAYRSFCRSEPMADLIAGYFGADHCFGFDSDVHPIVHYPTCLFSPKERPYCTAWHRDWRDNVLRGNHTWRERWYVERDDLRLFNQVNLALYDDCSTWVVPGSHCRDDLPGELEAVAGYEAIHEHTHGGNHKAEMDDAAREMACLDYCRSMPGACNVQLFAGDMVIYRNSLWHLGNYTPWRKRATLHDGVLTSHWYQWFEEFRQDFCVA